MMLFLMILIFLMKTGDVIIKSINDIYALVEVIGGT